jgi:hypothetical protein
MELKMMFELISVVYLAAIVASFVGAATAPRYRGPLIALGVVLTVPAMLFGAFVVYLIVALSNGAHIG